MTDPLTRTLARARRSADGGQLDNPARRLQQSSDLAGCRHVSGERVASLTAAASMCVCMSEPLIGSGSVPLCPPPPHRQRARVAPGPSAAPGGVVVVMRAADSGSAERVLMNRLRSVGACCLRAIWR